MSKAPRLYKDYFKINPKYYAAVTYDLIKKGAVKWKEFYPHDTFVDILKKLRIMLSGSDQRSLWIEGAYGTGKSHAALTIKSLLEASDDEIRGYFEEYGLDNDLCQKLITERSSGKFITIHRIGSASIRSDQDLILALQDSIMDALKQHGIENRGEDALRDVALNWFESKERNQTWFNSIIQEGDYEWDIGCKDVAEIISILKNGDDNKVSKTMRGIIKIAEKNGITPLRLDMPTMCKWVESIINKNNISIFFVWDEFTEYFQNNENAISGFQTLVEMTETLPFFLIIVTHESGSLIKNKGTRKKIFDRFIGSGPVLIDMPENMALKLMAQAMKTTSESSLKNDWEKYKKTLNDDLFNVRSTIINNTKSDGGEKTKIHDEDLERIAPIHPYAALLLKHMSVVFKSNARSMFDFIISTDETEAKGFRWFINNHGPFSDDRLLTIDMLWDFFTAHGNGSALDSRVWSILNSYNLVSKGTLTPDQERVFKTILLLEAISQRVNDVELLRPSEQNIDLAFSGTDWQIGKAKSIADGLCKKNLLFERPGSRNIKEYTVARSPISVVNFEKFKKEAIDKMKMQNLITSASFMDVIQLPDEIRQRYAMEASAASNFSTTVSKLYRQNYSNRFKVVVTFALDKTEATDINNYINKTVTQEGKELIFIECLTTMDKNLYEQYIDNMAHSMNSAENEPESGRAEGFAKSATDNLDAWKNSIESGQFMLYTPEYKNGIRVSGVKGLIDELKNINRRVYPCGLEQFELFCKNKNMFGKSYSFPLGADCGISQELKFGFKSNKKETSIAAALDGAWGIKEYWKDPAKQGLPIVRIKNKVEEIISEELNKESGRVSIITIYEALEDAPFGFMPNNAAAFMLGFILKEYATKDSGYFWSNGSGSAEMSEDKMKKMIAAALNQKLSPNAKYKEEYIVAMSEGKRSFLQFTCKIFNIQRELCGSIENARDQIRIKMKALSFPIWCLKSILNEESLKSDINVIEKVIDDYCSIANTANGTKANESELAEEIGNIVTKNPTIAMDMEGLLTDDMCKRGMLAYINSYRDGILVNLASEIKDGGAYIEQVKYKFNADDANWVWNSITADEKISDVILEYQIIAESNKSFLQTQCTNLQEAIDEWRSCASKIHMPYASLRKYKSDFNGLLEQLDFIAKEGYLQERDKQKFYDVLHLQRINFDQFYHDQLPYFKQIAKSFIDDLDEKEIEKFFNQISDGQFTKPVDIYFQNIQEEVKAYKESLKKHQLKELWFEKTGTKDPESWSKDQNTPILCMFEDVEREEAAKHFNTILSPNASEVNITMAIQYLEKALFYDRIKDKKEINYCFMKRVVGEYGIILKDVDYIRENIVSKTTISPYNWMDNTTVKNIIKSLAEKEYNLHGSKDAKEVIKGMDADELRRYLNELIEDNLTVGMEILRNK